MDTTADIGLIGLAVMGQNLAMNMADHGYRVAVYNRTGSVTEEFISGPASSMAIDGVASLEELTSKVSTPRKIMLMVKAGSPVDAVIASLTPLLDAGDIIIDGGNSDFNDTNRRHRELAERGILYVGAGVSGGEEGARYGPSIMPGGSGGAWPQISEIFRSIAAKAPDGTPCAEWLGPAGAGHFVKMVHNGIEYADMQVIAEAYALLEAKGLSHDEMAAIFREWGEGMLDSFLIDITAEILAYRDDTGEVVLDKILDAAGQKGTGKWTVIASMELGQPTTGVAEAVYARVVSALKDQRMETASRFPPKDMAPDIETVEIRDALYASKIISYTQGFMLLRAASDEFGWELDMSTVASLWRAGCIIRARFLNDIMKAFETDITSLLMDDFFTDAVTSSEQSWRRVVAEAVRCGIPVPAYASALSFFDAYRSERLPANLIQAQRDYFGAHTYERVDRPRGEYFHTNWTGTGGATTAGSYQA